MLVSVSTAAKQGKLDEETTRVMIDTMSRLNAAASRAALAAGARCGTDITGFGLLGHLSHIARASNVTIRVSRARVPLLPRAREFAEAGITTGGAERNEEYLEQRVDWGACSDVDRALLVDPQTSGGLLVALPRTAVPEYLSRVEGATEIGSADPRSSFDIIIS